MKLLEYNFRGLTISIIVSLSAFPFVRSGLAHPEISGYASMYIFNYALLLSASIIISSSLPPTKCLKRDEIYYGCCLFMCMCVGGAALQSWRLKKFGADKYQHRVWYLTFDEAYMDTPFGTSTEFWMDVVNYVFYVIVIYLIDNNLPHRNVALYWSGGTLTSELVTTIASFTGSHSHQLKYSELMHVVYIAAAVWVMYKYLFLKPRIICETTYCTKFRRFDRILSVCLVFLSMFAGFRGLAALQGSQAFVLDYVKRFEPTILHPSKFGIIWVLFTAVYGIPFQLAAVKALTRPGSQWLVDMSIIYAASVLQGTFVFTSYSFYASADKQFVIPQPVRARVLFLNFLLVIVAHCLMYRCSKETSYFRKLCRKSKFVASSNDCCDEDNLNM